MSKHVFVISADGMAGVDGEFYATDITLPPGVRVLRWNPRETPHGFIEQAGDSHGFADFGKIEPYVHAWEVARERAKAKADAEQAEFEARKAKIEAEVETSKANAAIAEAKMRATQADRAALAGAMRTLTASDHEVLKAYEAGVPIDPALGKKRAEAREIVRSERKRLADKETSQ
jgi:ATPase subunit of ABC transporter with duplicated ATPase domains